MKPKTKQFEKEFEDVCFWNEHINIDYKREVLKWIDDNISIPIEPPVMQKIAEGWISVDDKLPTGDLISEWVLVCYEPMGCAELIRNLGWYDGKWWLDSKTLLEEWEIKYWMPLPELPIDDSNFSA